MGTRGLGNTRCRIFWIFYRCRLAVALGVLALFVGAFVFSRRLWSVPRALLMDVQFTGGLTDGGLLAPVALLFIALAALFGRVYCSILCPMGTLQEAVWLGGGLFSRRGRRFVAPWRLRYLVPVLAAAGILLKIPQLRLFMDPISHFGRGTRALLGLVEQGVFASAFVQVSAVIFLIIMAFAVLWGRRFCDWCPVGTLLGVCANCSLFAVRLDRKACVSCGKCESVCPMNCVDSRGRTLSHDRCVVCLNCASICPTGALSYGRAGTQLPEKTARRKFFKDSLAALAGVSWLGSATFSALRDPGPVVSRNGSLILPPGAQNIEHFSARCLGCQACVAACPAGIIRADLRPVPYLDYTRGYCQYNCTECAAACPSHALIPLGEEKRRTRVALSTLWISRCVAVTRGQACGACAEVCPTRALRMEPVTSGATLTAPVFDPQYCIGCGGCFHVCPAEPRAFVLVSVSPQILTPGIRPSSPDPDSAAAGIFTPDGDFPF